MVLPSALRLPPLWLAVLTQAMLCRGWSLGSEAVRVVQHPTCAGTGTTATLNFEARRFCHGRVCRHNHIEMLGLKSSRGKQVSPRSNIDVRQLLLDTSPSSLTELPTVSHLLPPVAAHLEAIKLCADTADWQSACMLLQHMIDAGLDASEQPLTATLRACAAAGEWQRAASLLRMAYAEGLTCTAAAYSHAICACEDAGHSEEATQLYALAVQDGALSHWDPSEPFTIDLRGFKPQVATCALRFALQHEIGNYLQCDLKIVAGAGVSRGDGGATSIAAAAARADSVQRRVEQMLNELTPPLSYDREWHVQCDRDSCVEHVNRDRIIIQIQDLFRWLLQTKPYESYVVSIPSSL